MHLTVLEGSADNTAANELNSSYLITNDCILKYDISESNKSYKVSKERTLLSKIRSTEEEQKT